MLLGPLWRAIVPGSHGGVGLSAEHSQGGDTLSSAALRDGEQRQRLKCCRLACELTPGQSLFVPLSLSFQFSSSDSLQGWLVATELPFMSIWSAVDPVVPLSSQLPWFLILTARTWPINDTRVENTDCSMWVGSALTLWALLTGTVQRLEVKPLTVFAPEPRLRVHNRAAVPIVDGNSSPSSPGSGVVDFGLEGNPLRGLTAGAICATDGLSETRCASIQWRGVGAAPTPLLPATPTHSTAGRPGGPCGPAAVDCHTNTGGMERGEGRVRLGGREGGMDEGTEQPGLPDMHQGKERRKMAAPTLETASFGRMAARSILKWLVPIWDWEDAADEVKQLASAWSSKHRRTPPRARRERDMASLSVLHSSWPLSHKGIGGNNHVAYYRLPGWFRDACLLPEGPSIKQKQLHYSSLLPYHPLSSLQPPPASSFHLYEGLEQPHENTALRRLDKSSCKLG
ncbi:hypothetical protein FQN60_010435 [Etheostoma spectabile]|uniref:Uncharacterized protein n=1 Tax=Etheostoma spectabile TaxID=54343 RepID=A0A5J5D814_9PERO|nr:hypothetical protein FQN60_010435 [Etheostoma spectabile]